MPLDDSALTLMANALDAAITHARLHSADPGTTEANAVGTRTAISFTSDSDGDLNLDAVVNFTGLGASQAVSWITLWSASTGGTRRGKYQLTGDASADPSGAYNLLSMPLDLSNAS